jgi:glyoxylase-like metal-dependent hydrolase (beta-lactamase superfamily II)
MSSLSRTLSSAVMPLAVMSLAVLSAAPARAAEAPQKTREVQKPSPNRALPPGASLVLRRTGTDFAEPVDPDPRVGTYVSSSWGFNTSSYWIEGPDGLILIDTQFLLSAADEFVTWAEKVTGKKAVLAIVLHANPDKFNGTSVLRKRGIKVVTSAQVRALIPAVHEKRTRAFAERYGDEYPKSLEEVLPESFGDKTTELTAGGVTVKAHVLGAGCSEAHVVVEFEGHVFPGDLVANLAHSWLEIGKPDEWLKRLDEISALNPDFVHPGRGPSGDGRVLLRERDYLENVIAEVSAERKRAGNKGPTDEAVERVLSRLTKRYVGYQFTIFLENGIAPVWRAQMAKGAKK